MYNLLKLLRLLKWNLSDRYGRLLYINYFIRELPGTFGEYTRALILKPYFDRCGKNVTINQGVRFRGIHRLAIGDNVYLGVDNFIQASGRIVIGDNVMLGPSVKIWSVNHKFDDTEIPIAEQGYEQKKVTIGNGVWVGANVFIMPGVSIPEGCIISAGSVVGVKNYPSFSIISGNPARVIGKRN